MRLCVFLVAFGFLLSHVRGVDMSFYHAGPGVEAEFECFLRELYASAEDDNACFTFIDFFQAPEQLILVDKLAHGVLEILQIKHHLLPPGGDKHWNHLPNVTTVHSESKLRKVYEVQGVIESMYERGNCSIAYYKSLFPVLKHVNGTTELLPHQGKLIAYNDTLANSGSVYERDKQEATGNVL